MWESNRQTCITLSTAESELLNYVEALTVVDSLSGILEILEEIPSGSLEIGKGEDDDDVGPLSPGELDQSFTGGEGKVIQRVIYGDNSAAVSVLCSPDGSWRTRHLRVRSGCLRERLRQRDIWAIRHLPGALLVADHLTKAINPRQLWKHFFEFMQMRGGASFDDVVSSDDVEDTTVKVKSLSSIDVKKELIKICAAGLGVVAASTVDVVKGSEIELQLLILVTGLNFYIQKKIELLKKHGHVVEKSENHEKHGHGKHEKSRPKNPGGEIKKLFLQVLTENPETSYFECLRDGRVGSKHVDGKNPNQHEKGFQNCLQLAKTLLLEIHGENDECEKECGEAPAPRAHEEDDETPRGEFYARDGDALLQDGVLSGLALLPEDLRVPGDDGALNKILLIELYSVVLNWTLCGQTYIVEKVYCVVAICVVVTLFMVARLSLWGEHYMLEKVFYKIGVSRMIRFYMVKELYVIVETYYLRRSTTLVMMMMVNAGRRND